jgi:DNA replication licensing factor MCM3
LLQEPLAWIPPIEAAVRELAIAQAEESATLRDFEASPLAVGFEGSFGAFHTTPRHLSARFLGMLVCLDGIVTSCSLVRPKMLRSVHYAEQRKAFVMREYYDATMIGGHAPTPINYPTTGPGQERLSSEFGLSQYRDYQTITMQELPERAPAGQLPRSVDVVLDGDLVDRVKPGDRVQVVGVYKSLASVYNGAIPATFRAVLVANGARLIGKDAQLPTLSEDDRRNIRDVARRRDVFELLARSLAPSIYGHEHIKRAVLALLLGGVEKNLANGTHIRGDINLMLVGDPSTAKSQMLRFVLSIAPLAIATTGRGSSGVGLTAAVTSDKETGERRLEAGAMVLADRGVVCIDEFDKMSDVDRVAIHEVMEQQTVTIAKAGIHASLNARCSVLAAANPIWGQYRETASPQENIRLPDSLLSRFDLLFIVLDTSSPEHDRRISSHVLRMHRHVPAGVAEGCPVPEPSLFEDAEPEAEDDDASAVFQKHYALTRQDAPAGSDDDDDEFDPAENEILTLGFVKKYLHYARHTVTPVLTRAASEYITAAYAEFRQKKEQADIVEAKTFPVTPRTLETLIRLATAHAKARLSSRVEKRDAKVAQELVQFCLYKEIKKKPSKRRKRAPEAEASASSDESDAAEDRMADAAAAAAEEPPLAMERAPAEEDKGKAKLDIAMRDLNIITEPTQQESVGASSSYALHSQGLPGDDRLPSQTMADSLPFQSQEPAASLPASSAAAVTPEVEKAVRSALHRLRIKRMGEALTLDALRAELATAGVSLADGQIEQVLLDMEALNMLMYREGIIYLI